MIKWRNKLRDLNQYTITGMAEFELALNQVLYTFQVTHYCMFSVFMLCFFFDVQQV